MTLILPDKTDIQAAVDAFWRAREAAMHKQILAGKPDHGERGSVTAGANMSAFAALAEQIIRSNGLAEADIHRSRSAPVLPGFFRPTKVWDLVALYRGELVAVVELKSQVGSFGNNFNNRTEEAIGSAVDFWTAYREGAFGTHPRPFVGWFLLVEDAEASRRPVGAKSPHFPIRDEFDGTSYLQRYDLLCQKLVREQLYSSATLIASPRPLDGLNATGYRELSALTGLTSFMANLAGHAAATAARLG